MVGRGRSAFRTVVNDEVIGQCRGKIEHVPKLTRDALGFVVLVNDCEVPFDDRERIAIDGVAGPKRDTTLFGVEITGTQETWTLCDRLRVDRRGGAANTVRDVSHEDVEPVDADSARLCVQQALNAARETRPVSRLTLEQSQNFRF